MTIEKALRSANIPALDAEVLLAHVLHKDRTWLTAHANEELSADHVALFTSYRDRRKQGEPVALIIGSQEFYGRQFTVTRDTLIPRPATESLIDCVKQTLSDDKPHVIDADTDIICGSLLWKSTRDITTIIDVGTGSGCIAITLALEKPELTVIATDISANAIGVAMQNATKHNVHDRVSFHICDLFGCIRMTEPFLVVSNPPYIPANIELQKSVAEYEPHNALFAGSDGMEVINKLLTAARNHPLCCGIALECRTEQWNLIASQNE